MNKIKCFQSVPEMHWYMLFVFQHEFRHTPYSETGYKDVLPYPPPSIFLLTLVACFVSEKNPVNLCCMMD